MEVIKVTKEEAKAAESAFCFVVLGIKTRSKPKKGTISKHLTKWIKATPERQARFTAQPNTPFRRDQSLIAIYRYWRDEKPIVLHEFFELFPQAKDFAPKEKTSKPKKALPRPRVVKNRTKEEFYKSWEWRTLRMEVLKEYGARCQCCGASRDDTTMAGDPVRICVDHIKPLSKFWGLRLDRSNLQVLCDECNQGKGAWDDTDWRVDEAIRTQLRYQI